VQCVWRLCQTGSIIVGYRDFYYTPDGKDDDDWDRVYQSQFDAIATRLNQEFATAPPTVESFTVDGAGGFSLHLSRDYRLDVFPDGSHRPCEHWRLFQPGNDDRHFVFPPDERQA
jgi:hypothetical protein